MGRIRALAGKLIQHWKPQEKDIQEKPAPRAASVPVSKEPEPASNHSTDGTPWYLKGEQPDAGWDETNPGWDPGKKWEP